MYELHTFGTLDDILAHSIKNTQLMKILSLKFIICNNNRIRKNQLAK